MIVVGIRFKPAGKIYYFDPTGIPLDLEDGVIVETARGMEYGSVVIAPRSVGTHSENSAIDIAETSAMFFPAMRNCKASFFRRVPPQTEHFR